MANDITRDPGWHNICRIGRTACGKSQEAWAEALDLSVTSVRDYEYGNTIPSDDAALKMAALSRLPILVHWHFRQKSTIAADLLPEVEQVSLPQAVVVLLRELRDLERRGVADALLEMAADGQISGDERAEYQAVIRELDDVLQAAALLRYADGTPQPT